MPALTTKVLVVGGGPGGYVAAIRCGQLGLDTVLVENTDLGGTCLTRGCIPSKAIIHAASQFDDMKRAAENGGRFGISLTQPPSLDFAATGAWKDGVVAQLSGGVAALLKRAGVRVVKGWAHFTDAKSCVVDTSDPTSITAEHVILATGSVPVELKFLPFGDKIITSTEALSLAELPRKLVVVGAGYIGLELGIAFRKLGAEVAIVELQDRILPLYDEKLVDPVRRWLAAHGVEMHLTARARGLDEAGDALIVEMGDGATIHLPADKFLVTVGRTPLTQGWGLENMALTMDGGFVQVDDRCHTAMKNVWAIGDLVGEPMLAHKASAQGEMVAEIIAGKRRRFDPVAIAAVCFTEPEIVSVGAGPGETGAGEIIVSSFPFAANGRALSMGAGKDGGFVRIVARKDDHRILGIQAVGQHVAELSGEFAHAVEMGALLEDVAGTIHVHPTLSEAFHEAALDGLGHAIHKASARGPA
jgi:dihydrolipoamide dehydrogenase